MANIIELIKLLRERTGAGMMDCKAALEKAALDVEKAVDILRETGAAKSVKKSGRIASEGLSFVNIDGNKAVITEVNSETDFVAKNEKFKALVENVAKEVLSNGIKVLAEAEEKCKDLFSNATVALGEKLKLRRYEFLNAEGEEHLESYTHMGGKISVLGLFSKKVEGVTEGIVMHIAANNPSFISKEDIPQDYIEHETSVIKEQMKNDPKLAGKPEVALENILKGKLNKQLEEICLENQKYLLDETKTVKQVLEENGLKLKKFLRYQVGEGLEKREEDFASEVAKAANN